MPAGSYTEQKLSMSAAAIMRQSWLPAVVVAKPGIGAQNICSEG